MESNYLQALRAVLSGLSQRKVATLHRVSRNTLKVLVRYAKQQGWEKVEDLEPLTEADLSGIFSQDTGPGGKRDQSFNLPDYEYFHQELGKKHVTLTYSGKSTWRIAS